MIETDLHVPTEFVIVIEWRDELEVEAIQKFNKANADVLTGDLNRSVLRLIPSNPAYAIWVSSRFLTAHPM